MHNYNTTVIFLILQIKNTTQVILKDTVLQAGILFSMERVTAPSICTLPVWLHFLPSFTKGLVVHTQQITRRDRLYRKILSDLGLWCDKQYLQRKGSRTSTFDRQEIIPKCHTVMVRHGYTVMVRPAQVKAWILLE